MAKRMTKHITIGLFLLSLVFIVACQDNKTVPDNMIADKVKAALASYDNLAVTVKSGVVTLSGSVASAELSKTAADLVAKVPGVVSVDNKLEVKAPESEGVAAPAPELPKVEESVPLEPSADQTAGEYLDDSVITTKVKSALAANVALSSLDIKVDTMDKVVTLSGTVKSQEVIDLAVKVAGEVEGVKGVNNTLTIAQ